MNKYQLVIVKQTRHHIFFNLLVNGGISNTNGYNCLPTEEFNRLYKDLFRASRGNCAKVYCQNPPTEFYY